MPSFKSLLPLVLIASTAVAVPQGIILFKALQNDVKKTLGARNEPNREIIQVYTRRGVDDNRGRGAGGNGGDGGLAGPAGAGTKYGYGGSGARGGAGGRGGSGDYFSGKLIKEAGRDRSGERGPYGEERLGGEGEKNRFGGFDEYAYKPNGKGDRLRYRRDTYTYDGQGGKGGNGGGGSNGGEGKEFGRGGKGAEGGAGGNAGRGNFFKGVDDEVAEGGAYKDGRNSGKEDY